jgi:hypothetical protein
LVEVATGLLKQYEEAQSNTGDYVDESGKYIKAEISGRNLE